MICTKLMNTINMYSNDRTKEYDLGCTLLKVLLNELL